MYDLLIIGGGINGTAIACDAAGRGLSVLLCEKDDLASHTSSASTKLIHGGLRYLEQYEFKLVKDALREREILLKKAPHIIWPLEFVMPNQSNIRPYWLVRLGLFLYDALAGKKHLKSSRGINLSKHSAGNALKPNFKKGLIYSDCWVDDARLVALNAIAAKENGANILTRTKCISAERQKDSWDVTLLDKKTNRQHTVKAKALINAAGPWVDDVQINILSITQKKHITLVKGSHIIVPRLHAHDYAYILQHTDKRVLFVIPYLEKYSLIGTTDVVFHNDPNNVTISEKEISYLCTAVNEYFKKSISPNDLIFSYSGVRPLKCDDVDSPAEISRDYELSLDVSESQAPLLNIYGGKITTHRKLAEHAMTILRPIFPQMGPSWTENSPLPGGEIQDGNIEKFVDLLKKSFPNLPNENFFRYAKNYGYRTFDLLKNVKTIDDLGEHFGSGLYYKEIEYSINKEFSLTSEDILWRRTKLGFNFDKKKTAKLDRAIQFILTKK